MTAEMHPLLIQPRDIQVSVWRYLDFTKYVSLLDARALFLPRADLLGDPFEGTFGKGIPPTEPIETSGGRKSFVAAPKDHRDELREMFRQWRSRTYVSCWHVNEFESAAMWRLYASTNEAVAIRTTYASLREALPKEAIIGLVQYIDYASEWVPDTNAIWPFFFKRKSFEHEREVRIVLQDTGHRTAIPLQPNEDGGKLIPLELGSVVRAVVVAPTSPAWFRHIVSNVTTRYGYAFPVSQSTMDEEPLC